MKKHHEECPRCHRMIRMVDVPDCQSWFSTHNDDLMDRPCTASLRSLAELAAEDAATPITDQLNAAKLQVEKSPK